MLFSADKVKSNFRQLAVHQQQIIKDRSAHQSIHVVLPTSPQAGYAF